jgi:hypothetical protein
MGEGVSLRDYVEALLRDFNRRLEESVHDRERIRGTIGKLVPREEYDRTLGQALDRLGRLEDRVARLYGGLAVIVILAGATGIILRYTIG